MLVNGSSNSLHPSLYYTLILCHLLINGWWFETLGKIPNPELPQMHPLECE